jgi:hypothetical protein
MVYMFMDEEGNEKWEVVQSATTLLPWRFSYGELFAVCRSSKSQDYRYFNEANCNIIKHLLLRAV